MSAYDCYNVCEYIFSYKMYIHVGLRSMRLYIFIIYGNILQARVMNNNTQYYNNTELICLYNPQHNSNGYINARQTDILWRLWFYEQTM